MTAHSFSHDFRDFIGVNFKAALNPRPIYELRYLFNAKSIKYKGRSKSLTIWTNVEIFIYYVFEKTNDITKIY